jgi:hypothetical protein
MQDLGYGLRRIPLPRTSVNKAVRLTLRCVEQRRLARVGTHGEVSQRCHDDEHLCEPHRNLGLRFYEAPMLTSTAGIQSFTGLVVPSTRPKLSLARTAT